MDTNYNNNNNNNDTPPLSDSSASSTTTTTTTSAASATTNNNNNNRDQFLRHLNKLSHKISKPTNPNLPPPSTAASGPTFRKPPLEPPLPPPVHPPQQQQPPVYNINKSDFRDVVQKLTGSPAHATTAAAPPQIHAPKPASSRLQRIRPPPLAQLTTRPPPLLNCGGGANPHSPLPPLPTCHGAAESPISAYMRFLHSSVTVDSSYNRTGQMLPPPSPPSMNPPAMDFTTSYPPFGFLPSPKSPCPMIPPNLMFSPTGSSPLGFAISPTVPGVPSPK